VSRVGRKIITIPKGVKVTVSGQQVEATGPLGTLKHTVPGWLSVKLEGETVSVICDNLTNDKKPVYGLTRALVNNLVNGVSKAFSKNLEIRGLGFKAQVQGSALNLLLGFTHPCVLTIPEGIKVTVEENTKISISGPDRYKVGEFANKIRTQRIPEPYKGTGIRYLNEYVRKKVGKTGVAAGAAAGGGAK
jgi:large subunit ribosomal protein L6